MRIKEFQIHRYGPLSPSDRITLGPFNLFWGENEEGKTLTIDAVIKLLFGKAPRLFPYIDRIEEEPSGFIVLEDTSKKEIRLGGKIVLPALLNMTAESCRNLFVICNSELSLARESEFYGDVTERLTGLQKTRIHQIKEKIRENAFLTAKMGIKDDEASGHLKSRINKADIFLGNVQELIRDAKEKGMDGLEERLVSVQEERSLVDTRQFLLEKARSREEYKRYQEYLDRWIRISVNLANLKKISEEDLNQWREAQNSHDRLDEACGAEKAEIENLEEKQKEESSRMRSEESKLQVEQHRQTEIQSSLAPLLKESETCLEKLEGRKVYRKFILSAALIFTLFSLISTAGIIWSAEYFLVLMFISAVPALAGWFVYCLYILRFEAYFKALQSKLLNKGKELGFHADDVGGISREMREFDERIQELKRYFDDCRIALSLAENNYENAAKNLEKHIAGQREAGGIIQILQSRHLLNSIEEFQEKLKLKRSLRSEIDTLSTLLGDRFPYQSEGQGKSAEFWKRQLGVLKDKSAGDDDVSFTEEELDALKVRRDDLEREEEEMQDRLRDLEDKLRDVQIELNAILASDDGMSLVQSFSDLEAALRRVRDWKARVEDDYSRAIEAHGIFDEIEQDEERKVAELFGESSTAAGFFRKITGGLYTGVSYDPEQRLVKVNRKDGKEIEAKHLSGGAYDQLYFAIRLALGAKLLPDEKGFFILDDPFIKSDTGRLTEQMKTLLSLSREGWQIIYFSAKDEVKNILKGSIKKGEVLIKPFPRTDFKQDKTQEA